MAQEQSRVELKFDDDLQKPGFWRIGRTEGGNITFFGFCFTRIFSRQRYLRASNSSSALAGIVHHIVSSSSTLMQTPPHTYTQIYASTKCKVHQHCCDTATERKTEKGNHYWQGTIFFQRTTSCKMQPFARYNFFVAKYNLVQIAQRLITKSGPAPWMSLPLPPLH